MKEGVEVLRGSANEGMEVSRKLVKEGVGF